MNKLSTALLLTVPFTQVEGRLSGNKCPAVDTYALRTVDVDRLEGNWYQVQKDMMFPWTMTCECSTQEYKKQDNGDSRFVYRCYSWMMAFQYVDAKGSMINCLNNDTATSCQSTMDGVGSIGDSNYLAIEDDWFATYICNDDLLGFTHTDYVIINHRQKNVTRQQILDIQAQLKVKLPNYDFSDTNMYTEKQEDTCVYTWSL